MVRPEIWEFRDSDHNSRLKPKLVRNAEFRDSDHNSRPKPKLARNSGHCPRTSQDAIITVGQ